MGRTDGRQSAQPLATNGQPPTGWTSWPPTLVKQLNGIVSIPRNADTEDRREVYQALNVSITYHADVQVHVKAGPDVVY